jgi:hypothetical protein
MPKFFNATLTFIPFPAASRRISVTRFMPPWVNEGTVNCQSMQGLSVTVIIEGGMGRKAPLSVGYFYYYTKEGTVMEMINPVDSFSSVK